MEDRESMEVVEEGGPSDAADGGASAAVEPVTQELEPPVEVEGDAPRNVAARMPVLAPPSAAPRGRASLHAWWTSLLGMVTHSPPEVAVGMA